MTPEDHASIAADLLEAERTGQQIGLWSLRYPESTMDDAYAIQTAILSAKQSVGRQVIGWKIGLTSKAMQTALAAKPNQKLKKRSAHKSRLYEARRSFLLPPEL